MIIRCRKCETRFRFDEALIHGDGVWVRCSRCQNVFFQERPSEGFPPSAPAVAHEVPSVRISDARRPSDDRFPPAEERSFRDELDQAGAALAREEGDRDGFESARSGRWERGADEIGQRSASDGDERDLASVPLRDAETDLDQEETEEDDDLYDGEPEPKRRMGLILKIFALLLFTVLVVGGVYLWLFPEVRTMALGWASPWLKTIPGIEKLIGT